MLQSFFNKIRDFVSNYRYHELTEKNKELTQKSKELIERVAQVAKLTEDLRAKDMVIKNLEASLQEKNIQINY